MKPVETGATVVGAGVGAAVVGDGLGAVVDGGAVVGLDDTTGGGALLAVVSDPAPDEPHPLTTAMMRNPKRPPHLRNRFSATRMGFSVSTTRVPAVGGTLPVGSCWRIVIVMPGPYAICRGGSVPATRCGPQVSNEHRPPVHTVVVQDQQSLSPGRLILATAVYTQADAQ